MVTEEIQVVKAVQGYIQSRDSIKPLLPEEDPANDPSITSHLTEEEKKHREEAAHKKAEEEKKHADEENKKETESIAAMDGLGKI